MLTGFCSCACFEGVFVVFITGWLKKRKLRLLVVASALSIVWFLFFYYYNSSSLAVSERHLRHEFQPRKHLRADSWDQAHRHWSYDAKKQSRVKSDWSSWVRDTYHSNERVKENSVAAVSQNNSHFHTVVLSIPKTQHNESHIRVTDRGDIRQHQYSSFQDGNDALNRLPDWLRYDPSVQRLLRRQNISGSSLKHELLQEAWTTAKPVRRPMKPVREPLLAGGHKLTDFESDVQHSADTSKRVVISVVDSGFTNFAINFQRLSIDTTGLQNFLFVCIDREAVVVLRQHGIACSYYRKSAAIQVTKLHMDTRGYFNVLGDCCNSDIWCCNNFWQSALQNC